MEYFYIDLLNFCKTIFIEVSNSLSWFKTPFFNGFSPLTFLTIGGLTIYLTIALTKWLIQ